MHNPSLQLPCFNKFTHFIPPNSLVSSDLENTLAPVVHFVPDLNSAVYCYVQSYLSCPFNCNVVDRLRSDG
jgi:hypothetical protein